MLSNGEGLLMGIINGFGSMANRYIEDEAAVEKERKLAEIRAKIEEQKQRTLKEMDIEFGPRKAQVERDAAEEDRKMKVGIVDASLEKRAETAVQNKYADPVMGDENMEGYKGPLTDDQQSVLNEGMAKNVREREGTRQGILASNKERMLATGDAGLKMDPTAVNVDNKETELSIREDALKNKANELQGRQDAARVKQGEKADADAKNEALKRDILELQKGTAGNKKIDALNSAITREETLIEKIKSNVAGMVLSEIQKTSGSPEQNAQIVQAALEKDPQAQAAMKRAEEMRTRLNKMLEDSAKAPEPTPSATPASQSTSSGLKTPTTNDEIKAYPKGTRFFANGKVWVK